MANALIISHLNNNSDLWKFRLIKLKNENIIKGALMFRC